MITGRTRSTAATTLVLLALLPALTAAQTRRVEVQRALTPAGLGIHGFSVVLVIGQSQGAAANENVPEAARKALADMKDFLPYKRYQLLDAAWMLCCGSSKSAIGGRVRGPNEHDYVYSIDPLGVVPSPLEPGEKISKLNLRFTMREMSDALPVLAQGQHMSDTARLEYSRQLSDARRERSEAELALRTAKQRHDVGILGAPELEAATIRYRTAERRTEDLQQMVAGGRGGSINHGRNVIDSTFSISLGETVVIGTSRLNGDQALIALLTAAAKPGSAR